MPFRPAILLLLMWSVPARAETSLSPKQQAFRAQLASEVAGLDARKAGVATGADGWLFLTSELRFMAQGKFWGDAAAKVSRAHKAEWADPIPAIVDFHRQLRERGIELLLVPVPPKAALYPEKIAPGQPVNPAESAPFLQDFYGELRARGIDVLDLTSAFAEARDGARGVVYCRTDSHWSGVGCALAGAVIAQQIRTKIPTLPPRKEYSADWKNVSVTGDLGALAGGPAGTATEQLPIRQVAPPVQADSNSPVLLLGDSHTLVFHEFLAAHAGLLDQLAAELGFAPDLIGTRGSGATPVRISMYRRSSSDSGFLAKKKIVVWCFAAREFTEADQGWVVQPIAK